MNTEEYIASGILELYVFGLLSENENKEVNDMAHKHEAVQAEILSIEKAVINLSYSVAPHLSAANYEKIRQQLIDKHNNNNGVVQMEPKRGMSQYMGWAAAVILSFGLAYQYYQTDEATKEIQSANAKTSKYEQLVASLEQKNNQAEKALNVVRDNATSVVKLAGQEVAPQSYAKVYLNKNKKEIYVDLAGLPTPPKGKVYQIWALRLDPITPTSIGVIADKNANYGIFKVDNNDGAQAFGITLEPAGGSPSPTMEQLYTLGKV
ncbi:anti-sigma factor [Flavobacterium zepuense]|uniref:Anti-sigma factor n=1 Tax=Flavobacterium zepuense TaxID=2593302 RepID=A0A552VA43_9FLAO|nr:anti-sigma factor [Flavobacterium zepuense]TRW27345.1 anti-sigma factor [Flavobacterium zepuense]